MLMRVLVGVFALSACGPNTPSTLPAIGSNPAEPVPTQPRQAWWCLDGAMCTAVRHQCLADAKALGGTCAPRNTASCASGCSPSENGMPVCATRCAAERPACESLGLGPCAATRPPSNPELFHDYSVPGWWCWELPGDTGGRQSHCNKGRETCEWELENQLAIRGWSATSVPGMPGPVACARPAAVPLCVRYSIEQRVTFSCSLTRSACEHVIGMLVETQRNAAAAGYQLVIPAESRCEPWAYD